tara:strand:- start:463 stop:939 length:477 start_codon:yes stop_codon:yes gene_type:complete
MAYDIVTGQRTFCLGLSGLGLQDETETIDVPFVDSGGNLIKCNYLSVKSSSIQTNLNAMVLVELSGVSHEGNAVLNSLSALPDSDGVPSTSGVCGFAVPCGYVITGEGEWHGSNGQVATGIRLVTTASNSNKINLAITYGNLFPLNSLRLEQSYDAGV